MKISCCPVSFIFWQKWKDEQIQGWLKAMSLEKKLMAFQADLKYSFFFWKVLCSGDSVM